MILIADYDPEWPLAFQIEADHLQTLVPVLRDLEHFGSTAVPGLAAKPVIDMMGAVDSLDDLQPHLAALASRDYALVETGMLDRVFLQRPGFNLHVVTQESWPRRKERLLRDALIADPLVAADYAILKRQLAAAHPDDMSAYTRAKTAFVQRIIDWVHDSKGSPREDVWEG